MKPFPIPVHAVGPGSQQEDETLDYLEMPQGMSTYRAPVLPMPDEVAQLSAAHAALRAVLRALEQQAAGEAPAPVDLGALDEANRRLVDQVLGEGEVSARIDGAAPLRVQESVFAGVWRVRAQRNDGLADRIEVGPVPLSLLAACPGPDAPRPRLAFAPGEALPPGVMNAPSLLTELDDRLARWRPDAPAHVVNLTLLPLAPEDLACLAARLGAGTLTVLSRGYGNCRVTSTGVPNCWQVVYYNSQDAVILHTLEVTRMPDVVLAAPEDLGDSLERLREVLAWLELPA